MIALMRIFTVLLVGSCAVACAKGWDDVPASATAPTKELPCGNVGVVCAGPTGAFNDTCCWENQVCPGTTGCPFSVNKCCDDAPFDPSMMASRTDGGTLSTTSSTFVAVDGGVRRITPRQAPSQAVK